jgi:outer membrane protein assembly factor BamE
MALSACGTTNWGFPYRPDVQQGNWITSEQVAQLQQGMTREQVRFILGTPTIQDIFRTNRWDYPYYNKPGYGEEQERKFTVWFEGDSLVRWEGDQQPDRQPFQKADTGMTPGQSGDKAAATKEGTAPADNAGDNASGAAQASPVAPASSPASSSEGTGAQTGSSAQGSGAQGGDASSTSQAEPASPQHRRPILNSSGSNTGAPGVPTPGRSSAEPLR